MATGCQPPIEEGTQALQQSLREAYRDACFFPLTGKIAENIAPVTSRSMVMSLSMEVPFGPFFSISIFATHFTQQGT